MIYCPYSSEILESKHISASILNDTYAKDVSVNLKFKKYDQNFNRNNIKALLQCLKIFEIWSALKVKEEKHK